MAAPQHAKKSGFNPLAACAIIAGGMLVLMLLAGGLLDLCFMGETKTVDNTTEDQPPPPAVKAKTQTQKKAPPAVKALIELSPENEKKVEDATRRGVRALKELQITLDGPDKGSWRSYATLGYTSLAGLTLLECNLPANDPAVQSAAQYVRQHIRATMGGNETYQVALAILFLSRLEDKNDRALIRSLGLRLVASQAPTGGWSYNSAPLNEQQETDLLAMLQGYKSYAGKGEVGGSLAGRQVGVFQKRQGMDQNFYRSGGDNSNTQFALLAMWTARRHDLPVDPVLELVAKRFRNSQNGDGSWPYEGHNIVNKDYPTMTAAGLLGLAVGYGIDTKKEADDKGQGENKGGNIAKDTVLKKGLQRLAQQVGNPGGSTKDPPPLYFLWSVERVAVLFQLAKIEGKDWYHWGMEILLAHQQKTGKWHLNRGHGSSDVVDTCFALLFLQRANLAKDLTDKIEQLMMALGQPMPGKE